MALWGDVNVVLNRLVAAGLISRFGTNLGERGPLLSLHVVVSPSGTIDDAGAEAIRAKVAAELSSFAEDVTVTVDRRDEANP